MSYYETDLEGLGALPTGATYPVGQQLVAGYNVQSNAPAAAKLQAVRDAMAYGFRGSIVGVGWGGPGAPGGVPAGQVWIKVQIGAPGVTGAIMNSIFSNVGMNAQSRLPSGSRVTNTYGSTFGGAPSAPSSPATVSPFTTALVPDPVTGLMTTFGVPATPGVIDPATGMPYGTMLPAQESFFTQSVGGIPMWGLLAGGTLAVGAVAFVLLKPAKKAVAANRRRRSRRAR